MISFNYRWRIKAKERGGSANNARLHMLKLENLQATKSKSTMELSQTMNVTYVVPRSVQSSTNTDTSDVHQALKKFACTVCPQKFATKLSLNGHNLKVHSAGNPAVCEKCGKKFVYVHNLTDHVTRSITVHECKTCGKMFSTGRALKLHLSHLSVSYVAGDICGALRYGDTSKINIRKARNDMHIEYEISCELK